MSDDLRAEAEPTDGIGLCRYVTEAKMCLRSRGHQGEHILTDRTITAEERFHQIAAHYPVAPEPTEHSPEDCAERFVVPVHRNLDGTGPSFLWGCPHEPTPEPTEDDREALRNAISAAVDRAYTFEGDLDPDVDGTIADAVLAAGFRRQEPHQWTDAEVNAARHTYRKASRGRGASWMRAALDAAENARVGS